MNDTYVSDRLSGIMRVRKICSELESEAMTPQELNELGSHDWETAPAHLKAKRQACWDKALERVEAEDREAEAREQAEQ